MTVAAKDTQFAEIMKMTEQNVALAYRVPLQVLGIGEQKFSTTELMMTSWLASGLGFCLNHIEQGFDRLFGLAGGLTEYTEFDTSVLLRSDFATRVKGWVEGVKGRIFASDEARADFELGKIDGGDKIFGQQQDIPLGLLDGSHATSAPAPTPPPAEPEEGELNAAREHLAALTRSNSDRFVYGF